MKKLLFLFSTLGMVYASSIGAQTQETSTSPTPMDRVEVVGKRMVFSSTSYKEISAEVRRISKLTDGLIGLGMLVEPTSANVNLNGLQVWVEDENSSVKLPILPGGVVRFLADVGIDETRGQIVLNREKGELRGRAGVLFPILDSSALTLEKIRAYIDKGVIAMRAVRPALLRWTAPKKLFFSVCLPHANGLVESMLDGARQDVWPMRKAMKDDGGRDVFCAVFTGDESTSPSARIVIPSGAQVLLLE